MPGIMSRYVLKILTVMMVMGSVLSLHNPGRVMADPIAFPLAGFPGLAAMQQLSPVIQQAALNPSGASSLLMTAATNFLGDSQAPNGAREVANSIRQFLQSPSEGIITHTPNPGSGPGVIAHLPSGVDPRYAVGPGGDPANVDPLGFPSDVLPQAVEYIQRPENIDSPDKPIADHHDKAPQPVAQQSEEHADNSALEKTIIQDFMYPSIGQNCLADGGNSIATALSVAGPAAVPVPGPGPGQTAHVFTAVGTSGPAAIQKLPLNVTWINLTTGQSGTTALTPRFDINPDGPTTLTAIVDTGSGSIMSTIFGQVTTQDHQCTFLPTIGSTVVP